MDYYFNLNKFHSDNFTPYFGKSCFSTQERFVEKMERRLKYIIPSVAKYIETELSETEDLKRQYNILRYLNREIGTTYKEVMETKFSFVEHTEDDDAFYKQLCID